MGCARADQEHEKDEPMGLSRESQIEARLHRLAHPKEAGALLDGFAVAAAALRLAPRLPRSPRPGGLGTKESDA